jgi:type VI secretion system protein ImpG
MNGRIDDDSTVDSEGRSCMDDLLPYYERELGILREYAREFSERFPKTAGQMFVAGESSGDPHVERMIQSFALLTARVSKRLEEDYPKFTESMFEATYPHFLRPLPSYSIIRFDDNRFDRSRILPLPRASTLYGPPGKSAMCKFKSVYEVFLGPITIPGARFSPIISAPKGLRLPPTASSCVSIEVDGAVFDKGSAPVAKLRVFIDGDPSFRAALIDALFMHAVDAYVQSGEDGPWRKSSSFPIALAGLSEEEAMLPVTPRSHPAFRLLTEYFCYSEKFNFIDLDLAQIAGLVSPESKRFTLHVPLAGLDADSDAARLLAALSPAKLVLGCTPIINLYQKPGAPIYLWQTTSDYTIVPEHSRPQDFEIYSVEQVRMLRSSNGRTVVTEFRPLYDVHGDAGGGPGNYWIARRSDAIASISPGYEFNIDLIGENLDLHIKHSTTISSELLVTNRDLPTQLPIGAERGDLQGDRLESTIFIRLLRKSSPTCRFSADKGGHWRLISHLTLNHSTVDMAGLADLRSMLSLYNVARSVTVQRQINGIVGLECGAVRAWVGTHPVACLMPGIGIRMTIDEQAFVGSAIYIFAQVMAEYFSLNGQLNCFTQLDIVSQQTGEVILKCKPRSLETTRS